MSAWGQVNTTLLAAGTHRDGSARLEVRQSIAGRDLHPGQEFTSSDGKGYRVHADGSVRRTLRRRVRGVSARQVRIATNAQRKTARIEAKNEGRLSALREHKAE